MKTDELTLRFVRRHSRMAARALEPMPLAEVAAFLERLPAADAAMLFDKLIPQVAVRCLQSMPVDSATAAIEFLGADNAAALLRRMRRGEMAAILNRLSRARSASLRLALRYPEGVIGSVLDPEVPAMAADMRVGDVIAGFRSGGAPVGDHIFIMDERKQLAGIVRAQQLLLADDGDHIGNLMEPAGTAFPARASLESVRSFRAWMGMDVVPVVDHRGVFLGGVTRDAVLQALGADAEDDAERNDVLDVMFLFAESVWGAFGDLFVPGDASRGAKKDP